MKNASRAGRPPLAARGLRDEVDVVLGASLCTGNCAQGPIVIVDGKVHTQVDEGVMSDILNRLFPAETEKHA